MITISNLSSKKSGKDYVFSDIDLNFKFDKLSTNKQNSNLVNGTDITISKDLDAIKNNLRNGLFQKRHLTPALNIDLQKLLGTPMSDMAATSLGLALERNIALIEPRIKVNKIYVIPSKDDELYYIRMSVDLINFNQSNVILNAFLNSQGTFDFINI